jgi:predicted O-methyltransferase YrrM
VLAAFESMHLTPSFEEITNYRGRFDDFEDPTRNDVAYSWDNEYFSSPDAEVAYTMVRNAKPRTIVEVGSGHSTKILRQAILDAQSQTRLICIDPKPRAEIAQLADEWYAERVEALTQTAIFRSLDASDLLFVDSSHAIATGNDVVLIYLDVLPSLRAGVLVHIHDIFLPYDYPEEWVVTNRWGWNEQYLVQAMLMETSTFEVLWPGHYLQRTRPEFARHFAHLGKGVAQSLWLRRSNFALLGESGGSASGWRQG